MEGAQNYTGYNTSGVNEVQELVFGLQSRRWRGEWQEKSYHLKIELTTICKGLGIMEIHPQL